MKKDNDWMNFMYQDEVFYPFLILQIIFIWFFIGGLADQTLSPFEMILCTVVFMALIVFYAASGRRIKKMLGEAIDKTRKK